MFCAENAKLNSELREVTASVELTVAIVWSEVQAVNVEAAASVNAAASPSESVKLPMVF